MKTFVISYRFKLYLRPTEMSILSHKILDISLYIKNNAFNKDHILISTVSFVFYILYNSATEKLESLQLPHGTKSVLRQIYSYSFPFSVYKGFNEQAFILKETEHPHGDQNLSQDTFFTIHHSFT